ncbi:MAG: ATP-binding protein [Magnetococcales bacterium]|nr:ATP-binding protein [Magnetococcales bacterium]
MKKKFAMTSNVQRFLAGIDVVGARGAGEAGMLLVYGEPGYGKSRTAKWWALRREVDAIHLTGRQTWTPHWAMTDLVAALGEEPQRTNEQLYAQALRVLSRTHQPIVIDEAENTLPDHAAVLNTFRDLTDFLETTLVLVGTGELEKAIKNYRQISSRIADKVQFLPATVGDVATMCRDLCEVGVSDDLVEEIHYHTNGRVREIMNAIDRVERFGKDNNLATVTRAAMAGREIINNWQTKKESKVRPVQTALRAVQGGGK